MALTIYSYDDYVKNREKYKDRDLSNSEIELKSEEEVKAMKYMEQLAYAENIAHFYMRKSLDNYDTDNLYVEKVSLLPGDWYLYIVAAKKKNSNTYGAWTLNISIGGLAYGHYDIANLADLSDHIRSKKN